MICSEQTDIKKVSSAAQDLRQTAVDFDWDIYLCLHQPFITKAPIKASVYFNQMIGDVLSDNILKREFDILGIYKKRLKCKNNLWLYKLFDLYLFFT